MSLSRAGSSQTTNSLLWSCLIDPAMIGRSRRGCCADRWLVRMPMSSRTISADLPLSRPKMLNDSGKVPVDVCFFVDMAGNLGGISHRNVSTAMQSSHWSEVHHQRHAIGLLLLSLP